MTTKSDIQSENTVEIRRATIPLITLSPCRTDEIKTVCIELNLISSTSLNFRCANLI